VCASVREREMEKEGKRCLRRVVLVPAPFQGHINPMLQLGSILHSNGFSITVIHAQYNSPDPSTHPDFSFIPLPDSSTDQTIIGGQSVDFVLELNAKCKARFPECLAQVMTQLGSDNRIACIIHDDFMFFSQETAKDLKIPSIVLRTTSASNFFARDALFQLKAEGHLPFPGTLLYTFDKKKG
jgi:hypothetical protein